ncbi:MAG: hypothetical protein GY756_26925 [bacterium]|nr:hypothetical protein [bacterium]
MEEIKPNEFYDVVNPNNGKTESWKGQRIDAFIKAYSTKGLKMAKKAIKAKKPISDKEVKE